jgi:hypothetical protein
MLRLRTVPTQNGIDAIGGNQHSSGEGIADPFLGDLSAVVVHVSQIREDLVVLTDQVVTELVQQREVLSPASRSREIPNSRARTREEDAIARAI